MTGDKATVVKATIETGIDPISRLVVIRPVNAREGWSIEMTYAEARELADHLYALAKKWGPK